MMLSSVFGLFLMLLFVPYLSLRVLPILSVFASISLTGFPRTMICSLKNTSYVDFNFTLRVPSDGSGSPSVTHLELLSDNPKTSSQVGNATDPQSRPVEFSMSPSAGTLPHFSDTAIRVRQIHKTHRLWQECLKLWGHWPYVCFVFTGDTVSQHSGDLQGVLGCGCGRCWWTNNISADQCQVRFVDTCEHAHAVLQVCRRIQWKWEQQIQWSLMHSLTFSILRRCLMKKEWID